MGTEAEIRRERIGRFLNAVVWSATTPKSAPLEVSISKLPGEPIMPAKARDLTFEPFQVGDPWGGRWATAWFRGTGRIPEDFGGEHVVARVNLGYVHQPGFGGEALAFTGGLDHPVPLQGLNPKHNTIEIAAKAVPGDPVDLLIEAAANPATWQSGLSGPLLMPDYGGESIYRLRLFDLAVVDDEMLDLLYDWLVLTEMADALGLAHPRTAEIVNALDAVVRAADLRDVRGSLLPHRERWASLLERPASSSAHRVTAVGHAHIDSAWLWPIRETKRKCARTFSTAVRLMEAHPDFVFVCSQAQQHEWIRDEYPELFEQLKHHASAGQFEPVGSMWVEPDSNMPSGESLARQLIYGKRFFLEHYGIETLCGWLPDAFGFSGALPQIFQAAGVSRFLTQKLSWNEINPFPHHTFWWEGIDGSRVLVHCPPTDTYNAEFTVGQLLAGNTHFAQHAVSRHSLYVYGFGDGGGGPTEEMLQRAQRVADLDPLPKVELGTARSFFEALEQEVAERDERDRRDMSRSAPTAHAPGPGGLPVWSGELYLERHRGVQTTQAKSKLGNRRSECLLREAELWAAVAFDPERSGAVARVLEQAWKTVLLHQFHDILPGSSIHWVHKDSREAYAELAETVGAVIDEATSSIAERSGHSGNGVLVLNAATSERSEVVELDSTASDPNAPVTAAVAPDGIALPTQRLEDGRLLLSARVPGSGWARYELVAAPSSTAIEHAVTVSADGRTMSNGLVSVSLDDDGLVESIRELASDREVIAPGERGNRLQLHYDVPNNFDAWDVDLGTFERAEDVGGLESMEVTERGPLRAAVRIQRRIGDETVITQEVRLAASSRRVEFVTEVDWHERHRFLKTAFPVSVRSPHATFETQFGTVERPTHANTSWDAAKFEVPAQRYATLAEPHFAVSLLNDCKYGYDIRGNVMRLSLLRGPGWPDPEADQGTQRFSYAVLPHDPAIRADLATTEAEAFNMPLRSVVSDYPANDQLPAAMSVCAVHGAAVSAIKRADDGSGDLVIRLYEPIGAHRTVRLASLSLLAPGAATATRVDLLERDLGEPVLPVENGAVSFRLRPFELVTLRFTAGG